MNEDEIEKSVAAVRKLTDRPFAAMLFPPKKNTFGQSETKASVYGAFSASRGFGT